jgi:hypothetical protein
MTPEELYEYLGHQQVVKDLDIRTMVLDMIREHYDEQDLLLLFWQRLPQLDETFLEEYRFHQHKSV